MTARPKNKRWIATTLCAFFWSYGLIARFTDFFITPRIEKIIYLCFAFLGCGVLVYFIFHELLPRSSGVMPRKNLVATFFTSVVIVAGCGAFFYQPPLFPEFHQLEITPYLPSGSSQENQSLIINVIQRVELRDGSSTIIAPDRMEIQGFQPLTNNSDSLEWNGDPNASIHFERLMQAGILIIFQSSPQSAPVRVLWDDHEKILDLKSLKEGSIQLYLEPGQDWRNTTQEIQLMLGVSLLTEFLGLVAFLFIITVLIFPRFFGGYGQFRGGEILVLSTFVFIVLTTLLPHIDPVASFSDPQLEMRVREVIRQPNGNIRLHKVLTIAQLDASTSEIYDLGGIEQLRNLSALNLNGNHISDITPLSALTKLRRLNLRDNYIHDILPLSNLTKLQSLNLGGNTNISSITPLASLTDLRSLNLRNVPVGSQVELLSRFTNLSRLNLRNANISDIAPLATLMASGALQSSLDIRDNPIPRQPADGYAALRHFWDAIPLRAPFSLPVFNTLPEPVFSHSGGFFPQPFSLSISSSIPQAAIHYTLDGSEPTPDSPIYTQPIPVSSRSGEPNILSNISTTSPFWRQPEGEVFKASVVRAALFLLDGSRSAVITHTFFVDHNMTSRYSLPIVSLVTDPDYFFDYDQGIYVMGRVWDKTYDPSVYPDFWQPANYNQRGGEWERPVSIEFFEPDGQRVLAQNGGVRIHGGTTRSYPQKTLRLYADDQYGQQDLFSVQLFPDLRDAVQEQPITSFKTLLLRNSGNDWRSSMLRDGFAQSLVSHTSLDIQAYRPAILFINGEYWGIYNLRERMDPDYLASHYQVSPEDVIILENYQTINQGTREDRQAFRDFYYSLASQEINDPQFYKQIQTQMDIENFIDYQVTEIYLGNTDWLTSNVRMWRYITDAYQPDAPYGQDGRWRWMLFDTDMSFAMNPDEGSSQFNSLREAIHPTPEDRAWGGYMLRTLMGNSDFRRQFINRFADQLNTSFQPDRVDAVLAEMQSVIAPEMPEHINRWRSIGDSIEIWQQNIAEMNVFSQKRPDHVRQHIIDYFNLDGLASITLKADSRMGHIRINSIDITAETPGVTDADNWSGVYFQGIPIFVTAIPKNGYQFAGWEGIDETAPRIQISLDQDIILKAFFEPAGE